MVETMKSLEDEFDIEISDRDAETFKAVDDAIALVKDKFRLPASAKPMVSLSAARELREQSIPVGDVSGAPGLQLPQKHLCRLDVMAASIQRCNHPTLKGDVLRHLLQESFDRFQPLVQSRSVHSGTLAATVVVSAGFESYSGFERWLDSGTRRPDKVLQ
jgi:hypothetical protein